jgi:hypothetical protein
MRSLAFFALVVAAMTSLGGCASDVRGASSEYPTVRRPIYEGYPDCHPAGRYDQPDRATQ